MMVFDDEDWVLARIKYEFGWTERTTPSAEAAATPLRKEGSYWKDHEVALSELELHL